MFGILKQIGKPEIVIYIDTSIHMSHTSLPEDTLDSTFCVTKGANSDIIVVT